MIKYYLARLFKRVVPSAIGASRLHKKTYVGPGSQILCSTFDRYSYCGSNCIIIEAEVGAFCSLADSVVIGSAQHPMNFVSTSPVFHDGRNVFGTHWSDKKSPSTKKTYIGSDVWIGHGAKICPGVSVGNG